MAKALSRPIRAASLVAAACLLLLACGRPTGGNRSGSATAPPGATWSCSAAAFHACSFGTDPGWDEYNNPWNKPAMPPNGYTIRANSHSAWEVVAHQAPCPTSDCAVEAYASAQYNYDNTPGKETIASITKMTSHFNETMPTGNLDTNGFDAEAAYDIWLNKYGLEVMIWVEDQGQTPAGGRIGTAELAGTGYTVYRGGNTYSFVIDKNETSGTVNILAALDWLVSHNDVASSSYMTQFNFGWEICSTGGKTDTFTVHGLDLTQSLG